MMRNQAINRANRIRAALERNAWQLYRDGEINDAELAGKISDIEAEYEMYLDRDGADD